MASDFKDIIRQQQWFKDEVEQAAEARAMEMLGGLLDAGEERDAVVTSTKVVEKVAPRTVPAVESGKTSGGYTARWHNKSGQAGGDRAFYAVGPHGENLEVEKGAKRDKYNSWWDYRVNGQKIGKCYSAKDAKLSAEYAVNRKAGK